MLELNRRRFLTSTGLLLAAGAAGISMAGCNAATIEADIQAVLNALPTAIQIAEAIASIISGFTGGNSSVVIAQVTALGGEIAGDLKLVQSLITQYENDLSKAPQNVIGELDDAVGVINANLQAILNAAHVFDSKTQAAVGVVVSSIDAVLLGLEAIIPPALVSHFPRTAQMVGMRGRTLGAITAQMPSPRHLAKTYNAGVRKDFPRAQVPVPPLFPHWVHKIVPLPGF